MFFSIVIVHFVFIQQAGIMFFVGTCITQRGTSSSQPVDLSFRRADVSPVRQYSASAPVEYDQRYNLINNGSSFVYGNSLIKQDIGN